jgi:hypothetical protein
LRKRLKDRFWERNLLQRYAGFSQAKKDLGE